MRLCLTSFIGICLVLFFIQGCKSQKIANTSVNVIQLKNLYTGPAKTDNAIEEEVVRKSKSGNAYTFMSLRSYLGGLNTLIKNTNSEYYINKQRMIIDNIVSSSQLSKNINNNKSPYNDEYRGWVSMKKNGTYHQEIPLYESYSFFYITQFLHILKENGWKNQSQDNREWWRQTLSFIEKNEWRKWYERSYKPKGNHYWYFLRGRTHMGSHWAGVAMYLKEMTTDSRVKEQCEKLQKDYDLLLKRNLKPNPKYPSAYIWNSTYDNTEGTGASETKPSIIQDVSHGNHVVSYIVAAYELGDKNWSLEDIHKLSNTFKKVIYDKKNNAFADNVDGSVDPGRPGWGHFVADGWVKLSQYDKEVLEMFKRYADNKMIKKYNRGLQLKASLRTYTDK